MFTAEVHDRVPAVFPGARTTRRLRQAVADAVGETGAWPKVARSYRVSWPTVWRAAGAVVAALPAESAPTPLLGIDKTRFRRLRWHQQPDGRWLLVEPWESGFVDLTGAQGLLGQVDGRTSAAVSGWLAARSPAWRAAVRVVAIDPSAPYAAALLAAPGRRRGRPVPPGAGRQPGRDQGPPAGHPRTPRPARTTHRPGLGQPPPPAARRGTLGDVSARLAEAGNTPAAVGRCIGGAALIICCAAQRVVAAMSGGSS